MKRRLLTTLFILIPVIAFLQTAVAQELFRVDSLPPDGLLLNKYWRWHPGDNSAWASPTFDSSRWDTIQPARSISRLPAFERAQQGWFRLRFRLDSAVADQSISAEINQVGASEVYLDGRLFLRLGVVGPDYAHQTGYTPATGDVYLLPRLAAGTHTIAVRLSQRRPPWYIPKLLYKSSSVFGLRLAPTAQQTSRLVRQSYIQALGNYLLIGVFLMLGIIHFLYYQYRRKSINLVFGFTLLCGAVTVLLVELMGLINNPTTAEWLFLSQGLCVNVFMFMLLVTFYVYLNRPFSWLLGVTALLLLIPRFVVHYADDSLISSILSIAAVVALFADGLRVSVDAIRSGRTNARFMRNSIWAMIVILLGGGVISSLLLNYYPEYGSYAFAVTNLLFFLTLPISFAIILAREYAHTNQRLEEQLAEVRKLAGEKERILGQQNETLERQVTERTAELTGKNRDLEIEAALERIRMTSLAMHHSDEIERVVGVLFDKLKELGLVFDGGAAIHVFSEGSSDAAIWVVSPQQLPTKIDLPYDEAAFVDNPIILDVWHAKETGNSIFNRTYSFDEKNKYFRYVFAHNDYTKVPETGRDFILNMSNYTASFIAEKNSLLGANSWTEQLFSETDFALLKRVARVFEQAYSRFLDLQKAEAQAKEAQIELGLEKVRSRSMAMHQSHKLAEAASVLFQQINDLGFEMWSCGFCIWKHDGFSELWMSTDAGGLLPPMMMPYNEEPTHRKIYEASLRGDIVHDYVWEGQELEKHYDFLYTIPSVKAAIDILREAGLDLPVRQCYYAGFFKQGYLLIITKEPIVEMIDLSYRFAKVFEQTYTRFLDLQKAEYLTEQTKLDLIQIQTEKKRAEDALAELRITQTQLIQKEKLASLGELTAGIAHEIQNPLNFVNNFSEVSTELITELKEEHQKPQRDTDLEAELLDDLKQNLQKITHHGQRASSIVKGMLEHSRASTGQQEPTDLNALADEYLRLSYHGLRAKDKTFNCALITDFGHDIGQVNVMPQDIGRVLLNLYNNAFYAVQQRAFLAQEGYQPTVSVRTRRTETGVQIRVSDNGTGIPDVVKDRIFQPFFTTKPTGEGTGLGLSLSYDIVTKGHGGMLTVESEENIYTEFTVTVPIIN